jgi:microcystin-dependent protein
MKNIHILSAAVILFASSPAALAGSTPVDNYQPSLAVTELVQTFGIFPSPGPGGGAQGGVIGFVNSFAGNFSTGATRPAQGQLLAISQNPALFLILGTYYGGNGVNIFNLPDLQGRTIVGAGQGAGLSNQPLGVPSGSATITLGASNLPGNPGGAQPFNNREPSLPLTPLIATNGIFPSQGGGGGVTGFLGQVSYFAGNFVPSGWAVANGQLLSIAQNPALFSVIGTTYGGNGFSTFALPNLISRSAVGVGAGVALGEVFGQETTQLQTINLPGHGDQPVNNIGPSLGLHYIISLTGIFPAPGGGGFAPGNSPTLGEISLFAGNFAPSGWAFADGQTLSIPQNPALFAVLGTTYGGNGITTFDLPNLDGRTIIGAGNGFNVGELIGSNTFTLNADNLPILPTPGPRPGEGWLSLSAMSLLIALSAAFRRSCA